MIVGLLHPGEMGAAIGDALRERGHDVLWASEGRSDATRARARRLCATWARSPRSSRSRGDPLDLPAACGARRRPRDRRASQASYVDANAISPHARSRDRRVARRASSTAGSSAPPPRAAGETRLYLSGADAAEVAALFAGSIVDARVVPDASALKMAYAAWSKGTAALLLAMRDVARHFGVEDALADEWRLSQPELFDRLASAERSAAKKGWRWVGRDGGDRRHVRRGRRSRTGFHRAAAEVYRVVIAGARSREALRRPARVRAASTSSCPTAASCS